MRRGRPRILPDGTTTRDARLAAGGRRVEILLSPEEVEALRRLREAAGESTDAAMLRRLIVEADRWGT
ncbi:hypothetical protein [Methylobacterium aquaticum]|uniref:Uncharacterized protein n=1 Tax=Methylobacterium aquaticum TaxID=270351 RepID=A0A0J6T5R7_9HYPH|nr:hypothetical protein [Methylobacterium aquaticum]KMO41157.1 hypothetical protein VP06_01375 [Methylobacterium aquaticum]